MNGYVPKSVEDENYLGFLGSTCFLAFLKQTKITSQNYQLLVEETVSDTCFIYYKIVDQITILYFNLIIHNITVVTFFV